MGYQCAVLLFWFTVVNSVLCYSQDLSQYDRFQLKDGELYWENTYKCQGDVDSVRHAVVTMLKSKFFTFNVIRNEAGYNGEIRHYEVDPKRYGRTYMNTPRMYWDGEWTGKFIVEVWDNQYRVTVYALYYEKKEPAGGYYRTEKITSGRYVTAVTKKDKRTFKKNELLNLSLMSLSLKENFDIKNRTEILKPQ